MRGRTNFSSSRFHVGTFSTTLERIEVGESTLSFRVVLERLATFLLNRVSKTQFSKSEIGPTSTEAARATGSCIIRQSTDQKRGGMRDSRDSSFVARGLVAEFHPPNQN